MEGVKKKKNNDFELISQNYMQTWKLKEELFHANVV